MPGRFQGAGTPVAPTLFGQLLRRHALNPGQRLIPAAKAQRGSHTPATHSRVLPRHRQRRKADQRLRITVEGVLEGDLAFDGVTLVVGECVAPFQPGPGCCGRRGVVASQSTDTVDQDLALDRPGHAQRPRLQAAPGIAPHA